MGRILIFILFQTRDHSSGSKPAQTSLLIPKPSFCMNKFVWVFMKNRKAGLNSAIQ